MNISNFEFIIHNIPNDNLFTKYVDRIISEFNGHLIERIQSLEFIYCDFVINSETICLHQDIYMGISVFPKDLKDATRHSQEIALQLAFQLKYSTNSRQTWVVFPNGREDEINYLLNLILELRQKVCFTMQRKYPETTIAKEMACRVCGIVQDYKYYFIQSEKVCSPCYTNYLKSDNFIQEIESLPKLTKDLS